MTTLDDLFYANELSKVVQRNKTKRAIREYVERVHKGYCDVRRIDCPKCGAKLSVKMLGGNWGCYAYPADRPCGFLFPDDLIPPSPDELRVYWQEEERARQHKKISEFLARVHQEGAV